MTVRRILATFTIVLLFFGCRRNPETGSKTPESHRVLEQTTKTAQEHFNILPFPLPHAHHLDLVLSVDVQEGPELAMVYVTNKRGVEKAENRIVDLNAFGEDYAMKSIKHVRFTRTLYMPSESDISGYAVVIVPSSDGPSVAKVTLDLTTHQSGSE